MSGQTLAELAVTFSAETIRAYGGSGRHLHADVAIARELGFPDLVSWGTLTILPFSALLDEIAGPDWAVGGVLTVRLSRPVCAGDTVTYAASEVPAPAAPEPGLRARRTIALQASSTRLGVVAVAEATLPRSSTSDPAGKERDDQPAHA
ncbi:MAG TPA: MaoC family dehydratase [Hyphomicrobiales bacterium]|nr:MaoC family dehydratase [Hyphomicrobiales bacterium]